MIYQLEKNKVYNFDEIYSMLLELSKALKFDFSISDVGDSYIFEASFLDDYIISETEAFFNIYVSEF